MNTCPYSGCDGKVVEIGKGIGKCERCGRVSILCPSCKTPNVPFANYCRKCGKELSWYPIEKEFILNIFGEPQRIGAVDSEFSIFKLMGMYGDFWLISTNGVLHSFTPSKNSVPDLKRLTQTEFVKVHNSIWGYTLLDNGQKSVKDTIWVLGQDKANRGVAVGYSVLWEKEFMVELEGYSGIGGYFKNGILYVKNNSKLVYVNKDRETKEIRDIEEGNSPKIIYGFHDGSAVVVAGKSIYKISAEYEIEELYNYGITINDTGLPIYGNEEYLFVLDEEGALHSINLEGEYKILMDNINTTNAVVYAGTGWVSVGAKDGYFIHFVDSDISLKSREDGKDRTRIPVIISGNKVVMSGDKDVLEFYSLVDDKLHFQKRETLDKRELTGHGSSTMGFILLLEEIENEKLELDLWGYGG